MRDDRPTLLKHVLPLTPFTGWSEHTLMEAARKAGLDKAAVTQAFPGGIAECMDYFFEQSDRELAQLHPEGSLAALRMPDRISTLMLARLEQFRPHREAVRRAASQRALPWNAPAALASLYRSVDLMWRLAGDTSTDFSFYTKRMTLAGIYTSTLLFWFTDHSDEQKDTQAFLARRLQNVADFGRWKKQWAQRAPHYKRG